MRKVIAVTINDDGTIKGLLFEGNKKATPISVVIRMLEEGNEFDLSHTDLEVVHRASGPYVRKRANNTQADNLGALASAAKTEEVMKDTIYEEIKAVEQSNPGVMAKLRAYLASLLG